MAFLLRSVAETEFRSEITQSRKWGIYSTTNLMFMTYFKVGADQVVEEVLADPSPVELYRSFEESTACFASLRG